MKNGLEKTKIGRQSFFKYAGVTLLGIVAFPGYPFKFLKSSEKKKPSIKITQNPNAVRRISRQDNNG